MEEINHGVIILCEQMERNPTEFKYGGKFADFGDTMQRFVRGDGDKVMWMFSNEEKQMLLTAFRNMARTEFTADTVHRVMAPVEAKEETPKRGVPLTATAIRKQAQSLLEDEFDKAYKGYSWEK